MKLLSFSLKWTEEEKNSLIERSELKFPSIPLFDWWKQKKKKGKNCIKIKEKRYIKNE